MTTIPIAETATTIAQIAGVIVVAIVGTIFGIQKMLKGWKETSTESSILSTMHEELTRMSAHNKVLSEELAKFQLEVMRLNSQLTDLTIENRKLHSEVVSLTKQVGELQSIIAGLRSN